MKQKLAIIGTGIAGMGAAHYLNDKYDLRIFEKNDYVGGHTNTVYVNEDGKTIPIDTGFIVFNQQNYPNLLQLFSDLKVPYKKTDMSFSVQHKPAGLEYNGSGFSGLFAQKKNLFNLPFIKMLFQINKFNQESVRDIVSGRYDSHSIADYIKEKNYSEEFTYKYIVPMSSALWSTPMDTTLKFPLRSLVKFFQNHGLLGMNTHFQWYTVVNGSETYKQLLIDAYRDKIVTRNGVKSVKRENDKVLVTNEDGKSQYFDKVVIAAHADQAYRMLENPTAEEQRLLSVFEYQKNIATLHIDKNVMPSLKKVWSAWNYKIDTVNGKLMTSTTYYMNKLQQVSDKAHYFVTINDFGEVSKNKILKKIVYEHPIFTVEAMKAQEELHKLNENGPIYFCGSYFKYGFHEDALRSAVELSKKL